MKQNYSKDIERYFAKNDVSMSTLGLSVKHKTLTSTTELHWHDFFEIEIILAGKAFHHYNDTTDIVQKGHLVFLTPIDFHQVEPIEPVEVINITFNDSWMPNKFLNLFMNKFLTPSAPISEEDFEYLKSVSKKLYREFSNNGQHRVFYIKNLINCILSELAYIFPETVEYSFEDDSNVTKRALTYLYCNFRHSPTLHEVAQIAGLSDNYFSEVFRKTTGQTFNRFLNNLKLQYAYDLLLYSEKTVTEICYLSGFNSMTHFQREFKNKYHCTPSEKR